ncbi:MAG: LptE family protein [Bacteroidales bacterium]
MQRLKGKYWYLALFNIFCFDKQMKANFNKNKLYHTKFFSKKNFVTSRKNLFFLEKSFILWHFYLIVPIFLLFHSCIGGYSFTGASVNSEMKTFYVENFVNRASIVQPILSSELTYALINKIRSGTSLSETENDADAVFTGSIVSYMITPIAITTNDRAAKNRLTISIKIKYVSRIDTKNNFEETFTRYRDYDASLSLSSVEEVLIKEINEELVDDIFNKAFVNW